MPKKAKELKPLEISRIKNEGVHAVGGVSGLYLRIIGNSRHWVFRVKFGGKGRNMGLGSCEQVTLAEARDKVRELHKQIRNGLNPVEERRAMKARSKLEATKTKTFQECAESDKVQIFLNERTEKAAMRKEKVSDLFLAC